eukprot:4405130-Karenia_brevis.AAC.1
MLSNNCADSWFQVKGASGTAVARRGTCPGRRCADLWFNIAIKPVLQHIAQDMRAAGLDSNYTHALDGPFAAASSLAGAEDDRSTLSFMDDVT